MTVYPQEVAVCSGNIARIRSVHARILESCLLQCLLQPGTVALKKLRLSLGRYLCLDRWSDQDGEKRRRQLLRTLQPLWEQRRGEVEQQSQQRECHVQTRLLNAFYRLGIVQGDSMHEKIKQRLDQMLGMLSASGSLVDQNERKRKMLVRSVLCLQAFLAKENDGASHASLDGLARQQASCLRDAARARLHFMLHSLLSTLIESMLDGPTEVNRAEIRQYLFQLDRAISMALFSGGKNTMALLLYRHQRRLLELCLSSKPCLPLREQQKAVISALMKLLLVLEYGVSIHLDSEQDGCPAKAELSGTDRQEVQESLACIKAFAQAASSADNALPTERVVKQSYRLQLNLLTLFADERARLSRTLHRLLLWYWHDGMPLRPEQRSLLLRACAVLLKNSPRATEQCHNALLKQLLLCRWNRGGNKSGQKPQLRLKAAAQEHSPLPGTLAQGFNRLMRVTQRDFASDAAFRKVEPGLTEELQMLEQGAARLGLEGIETLGSALLGMYQWLQQMTAGEAELALLVTAHRHLQLMLNQAAAWHEIRPAEHCINQLELWLQARTRTLGIARTAGDKMSAEQVLHSARGLVLHLCAIMDLRLHFFCQCRGNETSPGLPSRLLDSIEHMLRYIVLERLDAGDRRRQLGKPVVPSLRLILEVRSQEARVLLEDDAAGRTLSRRHRHRLEHKCGCPLSVESVPGRGSRYHWRLVVEPEPGNHPLPVPLSAPA